MGKHVTFICLVLVVLSIIFVYGSAGARDTVHISNPPPDAGTYLDPAAQESGDAVETEGQEPEVEAEEAEPGGEEEESTEQVENENKDEPEVSFEITMENGEEVFLLNEGRNRFAGTVIYDENELDSFSVRDFTIYAMQESSEGMHFQINVNVNLTILYSVVFHNYAAPRRQYYDFPTNNISPMGLELVYWYTTRGDYVVLELWDHNKLWEQDTDIHRRGTVTGTISTLYGRQRTDSFPYLVSPLAHQNTKLHFLKYPQQWSGLDATLTLTFKDNKETWTITRNIGL